MATITPPLQDWTFPGLLKDRAATLGKLLSCLSLPFQEGAARVSGPFMSGGRKDQAWVRRIRAAHEEMGLAALSDEQLRAVLQNLRQHCRAYPQTSFAPQAVVPAFALVDEAIRRRLGTWRILDEAMSGYQIPGNLSSPNGCPVPAHESALPDQVIRAIDAVRWTGKGQQGPDMLLPARFYEAVRDFDVDGRFTFNVTDEQLLAAWQLYRGNVVEMQAGEGKTVAIAFAAVMHVIRGRSVHIYDGQRVSCRPGLPAAGSRLPVPGTFHRRHS